MSLIFNTKTGVYFSGHAGMSLKDHLVLVSDSIDGNHPVVIDGMKGLGDNLHQRAIIKAISGSREVWLRTPWPELYQDLDVRLMPCETSLRTQAKNIKRASGDYDVGRPKNAMPMQVTYSHQAVLHCGGFLSAMCSPYGIDDPDFSMTVPDEWKLAVTSRLPAVDKPIMLYRPLVERTEWEGCSARNPDKAHYKAIFEAIRERFFVVSVADLQQGKEWISSDPVEADLEFHGGELSIRELIGLASISSLVFCSPGFALIMAQAIKTKVVCVFGGHESSRLYEHGSKTDCLISPINPCECFSKCHRCDKRIDEQAAITKVREFIHGTTGKTS